MLNAALTFFVGAAGLALLAYVFARQRHGGARAALVVAEVPYALLAVWGLVALISH
jgi:hypothetical protein